MLLIQGRELWVFVFWILFLDITKMFHPLDFEIKNGKHYLRLNHITNENITGMVSVLYYRPLKEGGGREGKEEGKGESRNTKLAEILKTQQGQAFKHWCLQI